MRKRMSLKRKFLRYKWQRYFKLERQGTWRRARGIDNKIRMKKKGWPMRPTTGLRTMVMIRGYHPSGVKYIVVNNEKQLKKAKELGLAVYISSRIGLNKKLKLTKLSNDLGIEVLNG
ncbi:hypothetical protein HS7_10020 [Sulfolobales archaeon HS-7]|nr:hypothetical protein HS7_10020 [Sulfolobales archaeon HS-7]